MTKTATITMKEDEEEEATTTRTPKLPTLPTKKGTSIDVIKKSSRHHETSLSSSSSHVLIKFLYKIMMTLTSVSLCSAVSLYPILIQNVCLDSLFLDEAFFVWTSFARD